MATETAPAWLTLHGVRLEVVERGQGRPILWLHGEEGLDPMAPFLDLLAGHGRVIAPSHPRAAYRAAIPGARLQTIEGAGHFPHLEQPGAFVERVAAFLGT